MKKKKIIRRRVAMIIMALFMIIFAMIMVNMANEYALLKKDYKALVNKNNDLEAENFALSSLNNDLKEDNDNLIMLNNKANEALADYNNAMKQIDASLKTVIDDNKKLHKDNKKLIDDNKNIAKKLNTYEKYKYAAVDELGYRTDLTYDQIKLGEDLMKDYGYDPNILFAIGMVESNFTATANSSKSTAKGYCQFLDGTAKFTYEDLMGNGEGTWYPELAYDPETNIQMCAALLNYLFDKYDNNFYKAIGHYCGHGTSPGSFTYTYIERMNNNTMRNGINLYNIIENM